MFYIEKSQIIYSHQIGFLQKRLAHALSKKFEISCLFLCFFLVGTCIRHFLMFQIEKKPFQKLKTLGSLCNQTVNLKTDSITLLQDTEICLSKRARLKEICIVKQQPYNNCHRNCTNRIFLQNHVHTFRLITLCVLWDAYHELVCVLKFYASGIEDLEVQL